MRWLVLAGIRFAKGVEDQLPYIDMKALGVITEIFYDNA